MALPFGLDDILLVVASSSPLLWAKRGDVMKSAVCKTVSMVTGDKSHATRIADAVSRNYTTPSVLLPGIDLDKASKTATASSSTGSLFTSSIAEKFTGDIVTHEHPCIPHRNFHRLKQDRLTVRNLLNYSAEEVAVYVSGYSVAEVSSLYEYMERESLWEAALNVTEGVIQGGYYAYLIKKNLEAEVRTLIFAGETQRAVKCYLAHVKEVLLSDDVLVTLFDVCKDSEKNSLALYEAVKPFHAEWTPAVYACCLTVNARYNWLEALQLYREYVEEECGRKRNESHTRFTRLVMNVMNNTAQKSGLADNLDNSTRSSRRQKLQFLYHIILPLVADRQVEQLQECYEHMLMREPDSAVDVLLRCLHVPHGRELAKRWLRTCASNRTTSPCIPENVVDLAVELYSKKPNAMNMNSLLKIIMRQNPLILHADVGEKLQEHVDSLSMTESDASVLVRTVTDQSGHWKLATYFMASMIKRKLFVTLPYLSSYVTQEGQWLRASRAMAVYLSNRGSFTTGELSLCVESSVFAGRWKSALFWMERAHSCGLQLPTKVYDDVLGITKYCSWAAALRAVTSMHEADGYSERGILDVLETTASQGEVIKALHVISATETLVNNCFRSEMYSEAKRKVTEWYQVASRATTVKPHHAVDISPHSSAVGDSILDSDLCFLLDKGSVLKELMRIPSVVMTSHVSFLFGVFWTLSQLARRTTGPAPRVSPLRLLLGALLIVVYMRLVQWWHSRIADVMRCIKSSGNFFSSSLQFDNNTVIRLSDSHASRQGNTTHVHHCCSKACEVLDSAHYTGDAVVVDISDVVEAAFEGVDEGMPIPITRRMVEKIFFFNDPNSPVWRLLLVTQCLKKGDASRRCGKMFAYLEEETVKCIAEMYPNLLLIGIDVPSMDHSSAPPLPRNSTRGEFYERGIAVLEGLNFVGLYSLLRDSRVIWGSMITVFGSRPSPDDCQECRVLFFPTIEK